MKDLILDWVDNIEIKNRESKLKVVKKIVNKVKDGDIIGFGSGTTSFLAVLEIAKKLDSEKISIKAVTTSYEIMLLCEYLEICVVPLQENTPDWCFDGADEICGNVIVKGKGGAFYKEKQIIKKSKITYILVDKSKFVDKISVVPIACEPLKVNSVNKKLYELGALETTLRLAKGKQGPIITEEGNLIIDASFKDISQDFEKVLNQIPGVKENGLLINYNNVEVIN